MTLSDDEDEFLARFLESEVLSEEDEEEREEPEAKRLRLDKDEVNEDEKAKDKEGIWEVGTEKNEDKRVDANGNRSAPMRAESGMFSKIPPELFPHILKFLSSEDLVSCSLVCKFLNYAASDESLWRRLYCMRWGLSAPTKKLRECAWKKLYIERDEEDMIELVRNCPSEFKEYYIQMQAAKRSQAPLPSQVMDDRVILDKTVLEQVSMWKKSKGLTDKVVVGHVCSGIKCSYHQIEDVFICEETGNVHVCDENCREVILDPDSELLVCTISGHCFDRLLLPSDAEAEADAEQQQASVTDEAEPFLGVIAIAIFSPIAGGVTPYGVVAYRVLSGWGRSWPRSLPLVASENTPSLSASNR